MPVKKATPLKKTAAVKKAAVPGKKVAIKKAIAPKKIVAAKKAPTKKTAKGDFYECQVCGLVVTVDEACGCGVCDILCCQKSMKPKPPKAKKAKK